MSEKTIAVKLHPRLEEEGRGLCDPTDPRNGDVLSARGYGSRGYLRVYPSGFIQAKIRSGVLLQVEEKQQPAADRHGKAGSTKTAGSRSEGARTTAARKQPAGKRGGRS